MHQIAIQAGEKSFTADLYDTPTATRIVNALPLQGNALLWGGEIYFDTPLNITQETEAREILEPGELAFWTVGSVFCIFFGPTPASTDSKPRAYSPVNVFGKIKHDISSLFEVKQGELIEVRLSS